MSIRRRRGGFTFIELLTVVAILMVLVTLLLPSVGRARQQAKRVTCASQLRQLTGAITIYALANNDNFPTGVRGDGYEHLPWISDAVHAYISQTVDQKTLSCPDLPLSNITGEELAAVGSYNQEPYGWVIGYNYLAGHSAGHSNGWSLYPWVSPTKLSTKGDLPVWSDFTFLAVGSPGSWAPHGPYGMVYGPTYTMPAVLGAQGENVAYSDGSVLWKPATELNEYSATPDSSYRAAW